MITKKEALDDFVLRRVIGDDPLGGQVLPDGLAVCIYSRAVNGGCAIGKWIPPELYSPEMEKKGVTDVFKSFPAVAIRFEDSGSQFWLSLQMAHDALYRYTLTNTLTGRLFSVNWINFQIAMKRAADYA